MNRPILRLYMLVLVLFALLVAFTSRWTIFEASSLRENPLNQRALIEQTRVQRGAIRAADGTVLARSVRTREGAYERTYPTGEEFAQAIGYSYPFGVGSAALSAIATPPSPGSARAICSRSSTSSRAAPKRATKCSPRSTPPPSGPRSRGSVPMKAPLWRWCRPLAPCE